MRFDFHEAYLHKIFGSFRIKDLEFVRRSAADGSTLRSRKIDWDTKVLIASLAKRW
ncbi:hypothetical protein [Calothrix sp. UHCC 0171]|uniref:hypothetical protein n=1 Tax=Calothrix sp. UHCC 0171 TaxID=3110245 RepID=UPI002B21D7B0|nr:hypothetical protein [Calothrix sp. UHCC 0171]MEA5573442.1 hypothetical protein [Calothrix sp. UHCC 0171]